VWLLRALVDYLRDTPALAVADGRAG
jgi:hypothetical protein